MSPNQEENLQFIKTNFELLVDNKYRAGDKEHGGDLLSLNVLDLLDFSTQASESGNKNNSILFIFIKLLSLEDGTD